MSRTVLVNIDVEKLRTDLAKADGRDVSIEEVHRFLADAGFRHTDRGWIVGEANLGHLDPTEVISAEPLDDN